MWSLKMVKFSGSSSLLALSLVLGLISFDVYAGNGEVSDSSGNEGLTSTTVAQKKSIESSSHDQKEKKKKKKKKKKVTEKTSHPVEVDTRQWVPDTDVQIPPDIKADFATLEKILEKSRFSQKDSHQLSILTGRLNTRFLEVLTITTRRADDARVADAPLPANGMSKALFTDLTNYFSLIERIGKKDPGLRGTVLKILVSSVPVAFALNSFPEFNPYKLIAIKNLITSLTRETASQPWKAIDITHSLAFLYEDLAGTEFENELPISDHVKIWASKIWKEKVWQDPNVTYTATRRFIFAVMQIFINQNKRSEITQQISALEESEQALFRKIIKFFRQKDELLNLDEARLTQFKTRLEELNLEIDVFRTQFEAKLKELNLEVETSNLDLRGVLDALSKRLNNDIMKGAFDEFAKATTNRIIKDFFIELFEKTSVILQDKIKVRQAELEREKTASIEKKIPTPPAEFISSPPTPIPSTSAELRTLPVEIESVLSEDEEVKSEDSQDSTDPQGSSTSKGKSKLERTVSGRIRKQERGVARALVRQDSMRLIAAEASAGNQNPHLAFLQSLGKAGKAAAFVAKGAAKLGAFVDSVREKSGTSSMKSGLTMHTEEFQIMHADTYQISVDALDPSLRNKFSSKIEGWMDELKHSPMEGQGKPEYMPEYEYYARRLDKQYRLLYKVKDDVVTLIRISDHYGKK